MIARELRRLATAATFLTRLPWVARWASGEARELAASVRWFPLVGAVVGAFGASAMLALDRVLPAGLAALLAVAAMLLLTGAFHEDGWADSFDGLWGGTDREQRLAIMRDSRIGTYGAAALVLLLLARWQCLVHIPAAWLPAALIAAHAWARWTTAALCRLLPYARSEGPNKPVAAGVGTPELAIASMLAVTATIPLVQVATAALGLALVALTAAVVHGAMRLLRARLGGITGDTLGAANVAVEVGALLLVVAVAAGA